MSRFNTYVNSHFSGCRLLAEGFDACRNRAVQAFLLPGFHEDVGFTDGTDAWIVPLAAESCTGNGNLLKGVNLRELVGRIVNGESPPVVRVAQAAGRRRLAEAAPDPAPAAVAPIKFRRRVEADDALPTVPAPAEAPRRRHVSI